MALEKGDEKILADAMVLAMKKIGFGRGGFSSGGAESAGDTGQSDSGGQAKEAKDWSYHLREVKEIQDSITEDSKNYLYYVSKLKKQLDQIKKNEKEIVKTKEKILRIEIDIDNATDEEKENLKQALSYEQQRLKVINDQNDALKENNAQIAEGVKRAGRLKGTFQSMKADMGKIKGIFSSIYSFIAPTVGKLLEWEKSFRATQLSMGLSQENSEALKNNLTFAAMETNRWGHTVKELAEMQGQFSDELGRSTLFTEEAMIHMSAVAKATGLGTEGAAKFAAEMDLVGFGAGRTAEYIDQAMMDATSMGLNSTKVIKNLSSNLKLLNRYNFKGGAAGLKKMAENATKMGVEVDMVAGMADKLFDIEGAVEMSAQLQVLGGEWSKLADPFKLMYMARNDMKGLQETIINATTSTAEFNAETKQYEIQAMELHRLKKVAEATGLDFEQLATSARKAAQFSGIRKQLKIKVPDETRELIENTAFFDKEGKAQIMIGPTPKLVSQLTESDKTFLNNQVKFKQDAAKRAEQSRALDEQIDDIKNKFITIFFPVLLEVSNNFQKIKDKIMEFVSNREFIIGVIEAAKKIGEVIIKIGEFITEWPKLTAGIIGGFGIFFAAAKWVASGRLLRVGFDSGGPIGGAGGGGLFNTKSAADTAGMGKMAKMGANFKSGLKSFGAIGGGLLSAGIEGYGEYNEQLEKGKSQGAAIGRAALKGTGAGLGAWGGAAAGAAIGSVVPVVGTLIGGLIGGALGAWGGGKVADLDTYGVDDGVVFNPKDKFMKVNDSTMIAGTNVNGNMALAKSIMTLSSGTVSGSIPGTKSSSNLNVNINGRLDLTSNGSSLNINLMDQIKNNPFLQRELSKIVLREISSSQKGAGK